MYVVILLLPPKVKTTSPEKYKVKPSISNLAAGASNAVEITVQSAHVASLTAAAVARDKFLVAVVPVDSDSLSYEEIADLTKVVTQTDILIMHGFMILQAAY